MFTLAAVVAVVAVEALPFKVAVIVPAEKFPDASRRTIWLAVLELVAVIVALFAWLVMVPAVVADVAVEALPDNVAVIVPALKLPEASRATTLDAVFAEVASTAIVPLVVIVPPVRYEPATIEVTVPVVELVPAPIAERNVAASKDETVLSALKRGNVTALGFVIVNRLLPRVVAPKLVRAPPAVEEAVPPLAKATVPLIFAAVRLVKFAPLTAPKDADHVPDVTVPVVVRLEEPASGDAPTVLYEIVRAAEPLNVVPEASPAPPLLKVALLGSEMAVYANEEPFQLRYVPATVGAMTNDVVAAPVW